MSKCYRQMVIVQLLRNLIRGLSKKVKLNTIWLSEKYKSCHLRKITWDKSSTLCLSASFSSVTDNSFVCKSVMVPLCEVEWDCSSSLDAWSSRILSSNCRIRCSFRKYQYKHLCSKFAHDSKQLLDLSLQNQFTDLFLLDSRLSVQELFVHLQFICCSCCFHSTYLFF